MIDEALVGPPLLGRHAIAIVAVALLLLMQLALGTKLLRIAGVPRLREPGARFVVALTVGLGGHASLNLLLGALGAMSALPVLVTTVALLAFCARDAQQLLSELRGGIASMRSRSLDVGDFPLLLTVAVGSLAVVAALAPTTEWDSLMYHLRVPSQLLEAGRVYLPRDNFHIALVGVPHFGSLPLLALGINNGPALVQAAYLVALLIATTELARSSGTSRWGRGIAVAVVIGCPMLLLVGVSARVDVALALLLVATHITLLEASDVADRDVSRRNLLFLAAALIGFACGVKLQAGAYAIALIPLGLKVAKSWRWSLSAAGIALLVFAPWGVKNQLLVGSLTYPAAAPSWFQPWLADLFGGKAIGSEIDRTSLAALSESRQAFDLANAFIDPGKLTIEAEGSLYRLSPALLLLPLVLIGWTRARVNGIALVAVAYALLVIVPFGRINLRYLIPAIPGLAVSVAWAIDRLLAGRNPGLRRIGLAAVVVLALLPIVPTIQQRYLSSSVLVKHALGAASAADVWTAFPDVTVRMLVPMRRQVSDHVPPNGLVLMLFEARGFAFDRPVLADVLLSNWSFVSQSPAVSTCLRGTGITHLLINVGAMNYYISRGATPEALRIPELQRFAQRCFEEYVVSTSGIELWTLRSTPRPD